MIMSILRDKLMEERTNFGEHLGYDGKAIQSHSTGHVSSHSGSTSDPDADWGMKPAVSMLKQYKHGHTSRVGSVMGIQLNADTKYEIPISFQMIPVSHLESNVLFGMIQYLFALNASLAERC